MNKTIWTILDKPSKAIQDNKIMIQIYSRFGSGVGLEPGIILCNTMLLAKKSSIL